MALSDYEKQVLEQMEEEFRRADPAFASQMESPIEDHAPLRLSPRRIAAGALLAVVVDPPGRRWVHFDGRRCVVRDLFAERQWGSFSEEEGEAPAEFLGEFPCGSGASLARAGPSLSFARIWNPGF